MIHPVQMNRLFDSMSKSTITSNNDNVVRFDDTFNMYTDYIVDQLKTNVVDPICSLYTSSSDIDKFITTIEDYKQKLMSLYASNHSEKLIAIILTYKQKLISFIADENNHKSITTFIAVVLCTLLVVKLFTSSFRQIDTSKNNRKVKQAIFVENMEKMGEQDSTSVSSGSSITGEFEEHSCGANSTRSSIVWMDEVITFNGSVRDFNDSVRLEI